MAGVTAGDRLSTGFFREWGRIGQAGTMRLTHFPDRPSAELATQKTMKAKIRRGYRVVASELPWR